MLGRVARPSAGAAAARQETKSCKSQTSGVEKELTEVSYHIPLRQDRFWRQRFVHREAVSSGLLPSCLRSPTAHDLEEAATGVLVGFTGQVANDRCDVIRLDVM